MLELLAVCDLKTQVVLVYACQPKSISTLALDHLTQTPERANMGGAPKFAAQQGACLASVSVVRANEL